MWGVGVEERVVNGVTLKTSATGVLEVWRYAGHVTPKANREIIW